MMYSPGLTTINDNSPVQMQQDDYVNKLDDANELERMRALLQDTQDEVDRIIQASSGVNEVYQSSQAAI